MCFLRGNIAHSMLWPVRQCLQVRGRDRILTCNPDGTGCDGHGEMTDSLRRIATAVDGKNIDADGVIADIDEVQTGRCTAQAA